MTDPTDDLDRELVLLVQGELDAARARALRGRLVRDPDARARHAVLAAVDAALLEALDAPAPAVRRRHRDWLRPLLGLAAVAVVAVVLVLRPAGDAAVTARNDCVELTVAPRGGASHPLFTDVALELRWRNLLHAASARRLAVVPFPFGEQPAAAAAPFAAVEIAGKFVPLRVTATVRGPDGRALQARLCPAARTDVAGDVVLQTVALRDFEIEASGPPPYLGGRPDVGAWAEDFLWPYREMPVDRQRRWLPEAPGEWRIELRVDTLPPPQPGLWPVFDAPLVVETAVVLTAVVSDWGPEHDGLRARIVFATGCADVDRAPLALQIENRSGRTRRYNVTGTTIAPIPQPLHFTLLTRFSRFAVTWQQREKLGVVTAHGDEMVAHPDGTVRTLVVCADYFRNWGARLGERPGEHTIQFEFHFEPSAWTDGDRELWMGRLLTGGLTIRVP